MEPTESSVTSVSPRPYGGGKVIPISDYLDADSNGHEPNIPSPITNSLITESERLNKISRYKSKFDFYPFRRLEQRFSEKPIRGGILLKTAFRLVNAHSTCQQCLYAFEIDTYGRGCVHDCVYCYAKAELTVHGYWNKPIPVPVDINQIRKTFYTVFETEKKNKWRSILEKRIPLRIGSMSDSFMWMDQKYKVTQELLKLLRFYNYPYVIFTRSDLVATDEYLSLLDPKLAAIQFSLSSTNEELLRKIERGAPSAKRRLLALQKIGQAGFWTTVRINPVFPIYPDGYFTDPNFRWDGKPPKFEFTSFEMIDEIAQYDVPAVLAGFGRFSAFSMNSVEKAADLNLRQFFRKDLVNKSRRDFHFTDKEIRYYYEEFKKRCRLHGMQSQVITRFQIVVGSINSTSTFSSSPNCTLSCKPIIYFNPSPAMYFACTAPSSMNFLAKATLSKSLRLSFSVQVNITSQGTRIGFKPINAFAATSVSVFFILAAM